MARTNTRNSSTSNASSAIAAGGGSASSSSASTRGTSNNSSSSSAGGASSGTPASSPARASPFTPEHIPADRDLAFGCPREGCNTPLFLKKNIRKDRADYPAC
ncbi:unnamed protein product, partial [Ectocarpus sp. 4 AP-2014]